MILGILGKGGSGKTTLATALVRALADSQKTVLAIDADHNMDLAYNLNAPDPFPYFGESTPEICAACGVDEYRDAFTCTPAPHFILSPVDPYTDRYSRVVAGGVRIMVAGPHTSAILHDQSCSHILTTPLKVYLPFLDTKPGEYVVVDEKAGLDGVGTGVTTGFTAAIVVADPTAHSMKAARGIADLLDFYDTPWGVVLTKSDAPAHIETMQKTFPNHYLTAFTETQSAESRSASLTTIIAFGESVARKGDTRAARTRAKAGRNADYQTVT